MKYDRSSLLNHEAVHSTLFILVKVRVEDVPLKRHNLSFPASCSSFLKLPLILLCKIKRHKTLCNRSRSNFESATVPSRMIGNIVWILITVSFGAAESGNVSRLY